MYDPFAVYDGADGIAYLYPRDDNATREKGSFLDRAVLRVGNWGRHCFPISGWIQAAFISNKGMAATFGFSKSSLHPAPYAGAMDTYGGYYVGVKDDTSAMDAGGTYHEVQVDTEGGCGAAAEFSVQVKEGIEPSVPDPDEAFEPGRKAHAFGAFFSTSGTRWPYATNNASAAAYIVASENVRDKSRASFNRGFVFGRKSINSIDGHRIAHFLASGQEIAWKAENGHILHMTSDGDNLLVVTGGKRYKVALTPTP